MIAKIPKIIYIYICAIIPVNALPQEEVNVLQNAAMLGIANKWCKNYVVDLDGLAEIIVSMGINPARDPFKEEYQKLASGFEGAVGRIGVNSFCLKTYERFGPDGLLPGFMAPR